ncbi:MAG: PAS domain S-box protein [Desulfomonilaceae bacterium]
MNIEGDFYECLLDVLYEGVYFMDRVGVIRYWNHGAERITGFSTEDVIGTECGDNILIHADEQGRNLCQSGLCPAMKTILDGREREADHFP